MKSTKMRAKVPVTMATITLVTLWFTTIQTLAIKKEMAPVAGAPWMSSFLQDFDNDTFTSSEAFGKEVNRDGGTSAVKSNQTVAKVDAKSEEDEQPHVVNNVAGDDNVSFDSLLSEMGLIMSTAQVKTDMEEENPAGTGNDKKEEWDEDEDEFKGGAVSKLGKGSSVSKFAGVAGASSLAGAEVPKFMKKSKSAAERSRIKLKVGPKFMKTMKKSPDAKEDEDSEVEENDSTEEPKESVSGEDESNESSSKEDGTGSQKIANQKKQQQGLKGKAPESKMTGKAVPSKRIGSTSILDDVYAGFSGVPFSGKSGSKSGAQADSPPLPSLTKKILPKGVTMSGTTEAPIKRKPIDDDVYDSDSSSTEVTDNTTTTPPGTRLKSKTSRTGNTGSNEDADSIDQGSITKPTRFTIPTSDEETDSQEDNTAQEPETPTSKGLKDGKRRTKLRTKDKKKKLANNNRDTDSTVNDSGTTPKPNTNRKSSSPGSSDNEGISTMTYEVSESTSTALPPGKSTVGPASTQKPKRSGAGKPVTSAKPTDVIDETKKTEAPSGTKASTSPTADSTLKTISERMSAITWAVNSNEKYNDPTPSNNSVNSKRVIGKESDEMTPSKLKGKGGEKGKLNSANQSKIKNSRGVTGKPEGSIMTSKRSKGKQPLSKTFGKTRSRGKTSKPEEDSPFGGDFFGEFGKSVKRQQGRSGKTSGFRNIEVPDIARLTGSKRRQSGSSSLFFQNSLNSLR